MFGFGGAGGFKLGVVLEAKNLLKAEMRRVKGDTDEAKRKIAGLQGQLRQLERYGKMMRIGAGITALGAAASVMTVKLIDSNKQIEESIAGVGTVATDTYAEWLALEDQARERIEELAIGHRGSVEDISEGMYEMLSSGMAYDMVADGMDHVIEGNIAMRGELRETSALFGTVMNNFSDQFDRFPSDAEKLEHLADIFAYATKKYQMTGPLISQAFSYMAPTMKEWGMSVEEGVAVLGELHNAGIRGGMAGTAFNATMRQMLNVQDELGIKIKRSADGTYDFAGTMEQLREEYGDNIVGNIELQKQLQKTFGDEGKKVIVALWTQDKAIRSNTDAMKKNKGAAHDMAKAYEEISGARLEELSDSWRVFTASLMKDSGAVDWAVESLTDLVQTLEAMPDWAKELAAVGMAAGGVAGSVAGPAMMAFGGVMQWKLAKGIKGLGAAGATRVFETNPAAMESGGGGGLVKGVGKKAGWLAPVAGVAGPIAAAAASALVGGFAGYKIAQPLTERIAGRKLTTRGFEETPEKKAEGPIGDILRTHFKLQGLMLEPLGVGKLARKIPVSGTEKAGDVNISGGITVNTQAKDADSIAAEIAAAIKRQVKRTGARQSP